MLIPSSENVGKVMVAVLIWVAASAPLSVIADAILHRWYLGPIAAAALIAWAYVADRLMENRK